MKKFRPSDFWYEITQRPDPNNHGRFGQYYQVTCRECGAFRLKLANSMGDDGLRKWFMAHGWEIGKSQRGHTCSRCLHEPKVSPPPPQPPEPEPEYELPPPPEPPANPVARAWEKASYAERKMFLYAMREEMQMTWQWVTETESEWTTRHNAEQRRERLKVVVAEEDSSTVQRGTHIDSMPTQPPLAANPRPVEVAAADDDEPADWWKEMNAKMGR